MTTRTIELTTGQSIEDILDLLSADTEVIITRDDKPIARLSAVTTDSTPFPKKRVAGLHAGTTWIADDFDDPLPDSFWLGDE